VAPVHTEEGIMSVTSVAVMGAAGNMGTRVLRALGDDPAYRVLCVEADPARQRALREAGRDVRTIEEAAPDADVLVLAVPDNRIAQIAGAAVPLLKPGTLVMCLDPAAPYAGVLPERADISYFVTHPAHPPVFNDETDAEARRDFFGSGKAKQAIVSALMQGPEDDYARGEAISRRLFGPILRSHRVTVEQMAMLEPALSETVAATLITAIREAMDESIRRGVPPMAARDFLLGHIWIELAIVFNEIDWQFSDGAKKAIELAKTRLLKPDWKDVFEPRELKESVGRITGQVSV
jgi:D-apionate oxidoisomerase